MTFQHATRKQGILTLIATQTQGYKNSRQWQMLRKLRWSSASKEIIRYPPWVPGDRGHERSCLIGRVAVVAADISLGAAQPSPFASVPCRLPCLLLHVCSVQASLPRHLSRRVSHARRSIHIRTLPFLSLLTNIRMAGEAQKNVVQLAQQLAEGFAALSGEYQVLYNQQRQLECKLSWAKQQVCILFSFLPPPYYDETSLALDLQLLAALTENNHSMT